MIKVVRPAALLFASICLTAFLFTGCQEQKEKPVETGKSLEPGKPGGPVEAEKTAPPAPVSPAPKTSALPPNHPAVPSANPPVSKPDLKTMPVVTLSELEVGESDDGTVTRIIIAGGGNFASNVIRKENPERIILLIHNAKAGDLAGTMQVNNKTVGRIEVAQLESGQGPAVRVTVGLIGKSEFQVEPAKDALALHIRRP